MEHFKKNKPAINSQHTPIADTVGDLLSEGKKFAHELYEDGLDKLSSSEEEIEKYTKLLVDKVRKNPVKSVLIAGGVGFLLSSLLKK